MKKWIKNVVSLVLLLSVVLVGYAEKPNQLNPKAIISGKGAILQIVPTSHAIVTVPTSGQGSVIYTVTNNTKFSISQIVVNANYNVTANLVAITTTSDNCSGKSLSSGGSCQFTVNLQGKSVVGSILLMPRVCGFGGTICSVPVAADRITVNVSNINNKVLKSIVIIPATATIQINGTQSFIARAIYSDGSTADITQAVVWQVANSNVATIDANGVATGVGRGNTIVTATLGNITAQATLGVGLFAYIGNVGSDNITFCLRDANGVLTNCTNSNGGVAFANILGLALNSSGTNLYVADSVNGAVYHCTTNNNGSINQCTLATSIAAATGVAINPAGTILYIANQSNLLTYCPINANGSLGACATTGNNFTVADSIAFNSQGTRVYITNTPNSVFYCPVNANGTLGTCNATGNGFNGPLGIALNSNNTQAYVSNTGSSQISRCPINANGSFGTCNITGSGFIVPFFVAVDFANTNSYVSNFIPSTISHCNIDSNGDFINCTQPAGPPVSGPTGIALFH